MENIWPFLRLYLGSLLYNLCEGYPIDLRTAEAGVAAEWTYLSSVLAVAFLMTAVLLVTGCVCCRQNKGFQEFTDSASSHSLSGAGGGYVNSAASTTEFTIFPPVQSTAAVSHNQPGDRSSVIRFEPLPDIRPTQVHTRRPAAFNNVVNHGLSAEDWFQDPHVNFPRQQLKYVRELGCGWYGRVVEGEAQGIVPDEKSTRVVVKILHEDATTTDQMYFLHEVKPYRDLSHPNVLRLLGRCLETDPFLVLLESCPSGDLKSFLSQNIATAEALNKQGITLRMACNISAGLQHMHNNGFVHTDLAARNCLVTPDLTVKIGDYGTSIDIFKEDYYCAGDVALPIRWCAPETLHCTETTIETKEVTQGANVWSLGVVLWEICEFGKLPYTELSDDEVIVKVLSEVACRLPPPTLTSQQGQNMYLLMKQCWSHQKVRPALTQVCAMLNHLHSSRERYGQDGDNTSLKTDEDFERRWEMFKPNTIPKTDNHVPNKTSTSTTNEDKPHLHLDTDTLSVDRTSLTTSPQPSLASSSGGDFYLPTLHQRHKSPSLQNLHGSIDDLSESAEQAEWQKTSKVGEQDEVSSQPSFEEREKIVEEKTVMLEPDFDSWLRGVETTNEEDAKFVRKISEAIRDLDNALALEKTSSSSSEASSHCTSQQHTPAKDITSVLTEENVVLDFRLGRADSGVSSDDREMTFQPDSLQEDSYLDCGKDRGTDSGTDTEDETWRRRIERGEFSEKVKEKSKSVADLMVLTHIECSDGSDSEPPSLTWSIDRSSNGRGSFRLRHGSTNKNTPMLAYSSENDIHEAVLGEDFKNTLRRLQAEVQRTVTKHILPITDTEEQALLPSNHNRNENFLVIDASEETQKEKQSKVPEEDSCCGSMLLDNVPHTNVIESCFYSLDRKKKTDAGTSCLHNPNSWETKSKSNITHTDKCSEPLQTSIIDSCQKIPSFQSEVTCTPDKLIAPEGLPATANKFRSTDDAPTVILGACEDYTLDYFQGLKTTLGDEHEELKNITLYGNASNVQQNLVGYSIDSWDKHLSSAFQEHETQTDLFTAKFKERENIFDDDENNVLKTFMDHKEGKNRASPYEFLVEEKLDISDHNQAPNFLTVEHAGAIKAGDIAYIEEKLKHHALCIPSLNVIAATPVPSGRNSPEGYQMTIMPNVVRTDSQSETEIEGKEQVDKKTEQKSVKACDPCFNFPVVLTNGAKQDSCVEECPYTTWDINEADGMQKVVRCDNQYSSTAQDTIKHRNEVSGATKNRNKVNDLQKIDSCDNQYPPTVQGVKEHTHEVSGVENVHSFDKEFIFTVQDVVDGVQSVDTSGNQYPITAQDSTEHKNVLVGVDSCDNQYYSTVQDTKEHIHEIDGVQNVVSYDNQYPFTSQNIKEHIHEGDSVQKVHSYDKEFLPTVQGIRNEVHDLQKIDSCDKKFISTVQDITEQKNEVDDVHNVDICDKTFLFTVQDTIDDKNEVDDEQKVVSCDNQYTSTVQNTLPHGNEVDGVQKVDSCDKQYPSTSQDIKEHIHEGDSVQKIDSYCDKSFQSTVQDTIEHKNKVGGVQKIGSCNIQYPCTMQDIKEHEANGVQKIDSCVKEFPSTVKETTDKNEVVCVQKVDKCDNQCSITVQDIKEHMHEIDGVQNIDSCDKAFLSTVQNIKEHLHEVNGVQKIDCGNKEFPYTVQDITDNKNEVDGVQKVDNCDNQHPFTAQDIKEHIHEIGNVQNIDSCDEEFPSAVQAVTDGVQKVDKCDNQCSATAQDIKEHIHEIDGVQKIDSCDKAFLSTVEDTTEHTHEVNVVQKIDSCDKAFLSTVQNIKEHLHEVNGVQKIDSCDKKFPSTVQDTTGYKNAVDGIQKVDTCDNHYPSTVQDIKDYIHEIDGVPNIDSCDKEFSSTVQDTTDHKKEINGVQKVGNCDNHYPSTAQDIKEHIHGIDVVQNIDSCDKEFPPTVQDTTDHIKEVNDVQKVVNCDKAFLSTVQNATEHAHEVNGVQKVDSCDKAFLSIVQDATEHTHEENGVQKIEKDFLSTVQDIMEHKNKNDGVQKVNNCDNQYPSTLQDTTGHRNEVNNTTENRNKVNGMQKIDGYDKQYPLTAHATTEHINEIDGVQKVDRYENQCSFTVQHITEHRNEVADILEHRNEVNVVQNIHSCDKQYPLTAHATTEHINKIDGVCDVLYAPTVQDTTGHRNEVDITTEHITEVNGVQKVDNCDIDFLSILQDINQVGDVQTVDSCDKHYPSTIQNATEHRNEVAVITEHITEVNGVQRVDSCDKQYTSTVQATMEHKNKVNDVRKINNSDKHCPFKVQDTTEHRNEENVDRCVNQCPSTVQNIRETINKIGSVQNVDSCDYQYPHTVQDIIETEMTEHRKPLGDKQKDDICDKQEVSEHKTELNDITKVDILLDKQGSKGDLLITKGSLFCKPSSLVSDLLSSEVMKHSEHLEFSIHKEPVMALSQIEGRQTSQVFGEKEANQVTAALNSWKQSGQQNRMLMEDFLLGERLASGPFEEEEMAKQSTPDDERSSDSGFRDKGSLSESCDDACDEKYHLEDIEAELEESSKSGYEHKNIPSEDEWLEKVEMHDNSCAVSRDSEHAAFGKSNVSLFQDENVSASTSSQAVLSLSVDSDKDVYSDSIFTSEVDCGLAEREYDACAQESQLKDVDDVFEVNDDHCKTGWYLHPQVGSQELQEDDHHQGSSWTTSGTSDSNGNDNSYVSFNLEEEFVTAIRNELREKLPCIAMHQQQEEEEEEEMYEDELSSEDRTDIVIHYNTYPAPLSPILEERESVSSITTTLSDHVSPFAHSRDILKSESDSESMSPVFMLDPKEEAEERSRQSEVDAKRFEEEIREALENCSISSEEMSSLSDGNTKKSSVLFEDLEQQWKGEEVVVVQNTNQNSEDDDLLVVDTETNEATLLESPKPKSHLAFVRKVVQENIATPSDDEELTVGINSETYVISKSRFSDEDILEKQKNTSSDEEVYTPDSISPENAVTASLFSPDTENMSDFFLTPSEKSPSNNGDLFLHNLNNNTNMGPTLEAVQEIVANNEAAEIISELQNASICNNNSILLFNANNNDNNWLVPRVARNDNVTISVEEIDHSSPESDKLDRLGYLRSPNLDVPREETEERDWSLPNLDAALLSTKAPMPSPEEESWKQIPSMLAFSDLNEVMARCGNNAEEEDEDPYPYQVDDNDLMSTSFSVNPDEQECYIPDWESGDSDETNEDDNNSSSSGEFIWKDGDKEASVKAVDISAAAAATAVSVAAKYDGLSDFPMEVIAEEDEDEEDDADGSSSCGSGTEFVPSAWNSEATPNRSALRSPDKRSEEDEAYDHKKNVSFKKQKYHCVYEYPRENSDSDSEGFDSPTRQPHWSSMSYQAPVVDYASFADWELLDGDTLPADSQDTDTDPDDNPSQQQLDFYKLSNVDYDFGCGGMVSEDGEFFISSSARPFQFSGVGSNGVEVSGSQFFPGATTRIEDVSLDFITPDSGITDMTGTAQSNDNIVDTREEDVEVSEVMNKVTEWESDDVTETLCDDANDRDPPQSPSSPMSPSGLGELRHTRDRLKLDLPTKNTAFVLDPPALGKRRAVETVKGEASLLDSGEETEDSGIESSNGAISSSKTLSLADNMKDTKV